MKHVFLLVCMVVASINLMSQPPFMIEKVISENKIVNYNNQPLLLLDFWASWCLTCAPATKQLEILQELRPNDVFMVAVSDEKEEAISNYLRRNPIRLAVLKDYLPNSMVEYFNVYSRPYAVLLSLDGKILFQGHPSDINREMIDRFASQNKSKPQKKWDDLFYVVKNTNPITKPINNGEIKIIKQPLGEKRMYIENGVFHYHGTLSELIQFLTAYSSYQIEFSNMTDYGVLLTCSESDLNSKPHILQSIEKQLSFNIQTGSKQVDAYIIDVVNPRLLWDDKQINWNNGINPTYVVGSDRVEADNMTLKELANLLSDIKGTLHYYKGNDNSLRDWNFHYHYDNLMIEDLSSSFGIQLKKEKITLPLYIISP